MSDGDERPVLITGGGGYVGSHIAALGRPGVQVSRRDECDLFELAARIGAIRPRAVVHLAAMSRIGDCEKDPLDAARVNVKGTVELAKASSSVGARFLFASTDQVFDGLCGLYREEDLPSPVSLYGKTKAEAEQALRTLNLKDRLIVRLNLVVGKGTPDRQSGTDELLISAREGKPIRLFRDEFRSPIHVRDAARAFLHLANHSIQGTLHLGGPERLSRLAIGQAVLKAANLSPATIDVVSLESFAGPPRAPDTSFDNLKMMKVIGPIVRPLATALRDAL